MKKIVLLAILSTFMIGCGARKVNKSQVEVKQDVEIVKTEAVVETKQEVTKQVDTSTIVTKVIEPVDSTKSMVIDGVKYENVKITLTKTKKGVTTLKKYDSILNVLKNDSEKVSTKVVEATKSSENKKGFPWWILIIVLIILIALNFNSIRKYIAG